MKSVLQQAHALRNGERSNVNLLGDDLEGEFAHCVLDVTRSFDDCCKRFLRSCDHTENSATNIRVRITSHEKEIRYKR